MLSAVLEDAVGFIDRSRNLILQHFNSTREFKIKPDGSPVTLADLEAEDLLRELIRSHYPSHGVIGEEHGSDNPGAEFQWTIDPVDGTQNFAAGIPTFGTLLGIRYQGKAVLGIIDHPALDIRYAGAIGLGVTCNGKPVGNDRRISAYEVIASGTRSGYLRSGKGDIFDRLLAQFPDTRIYYDCFAHGLAISGALAAMVEYNVRIWDLTPVECLIQEAGGVYHRLDDPAALDSAGFTSSVHGQKDAVERVLRCIAG